MCFIIEKSLYKENKALKRQIEEYKKRIKIDKDVMLVEALNCYLKDKKLVDDFKKFVKTYTGELFLEDNELDKVWDEI